MIIKTLFFKFIHINNKNPENFTSCPDTKLFEMSYPQLQDGILSCSERQIAFIKKSDRYDKSYSMWIASAGQTSTQVWQSTHMSLSTFAFSFSIAIADAGHSLTQVSHPVHFVVNDSYQLFTPSLLWGKRQKKVSIWTGVKREEGLFFLKAKDIAHAIDAWFFTNNPSGRTEGTARKDRTVICPVGEFDRLEIFREHHLMIAHNVPAPDHVDTNLILRVPSCLPGHRVFRAARLLHRGSAGLFLPCRSGRPSCSGGVPRSPRYRNP